MSIAKLVILCVKLAHSVQLTVPLARLASCSIKPALVSALRIPMDRIVSAFLALLQFKRAPLL